MADTKLLHGSMGFESTPGTPVSTTQYLFGELRYTDDIDRVWFKRTPNVRSARSGSYIDVRRIGRWTFNSGDDGIGFEELPGFLSIGIESVTAGASSGSMFVWTYTGSLAASPALKTATINQWDENTSALESSYAVARQLRLSGAPGELARFSAELFSKSASYTTTKDSLSASNNIAVIAGGNVRIYFADSWAGLSSAASISGLLRDWDVTINTGLIPKYFADGTVEFSRVGAMGERSIEFSGQYEWDNVGASQWIDFRTKPTRFVRFEATDNASRYLRIDFAAGYVSVEPWSGDVDGNALGAFRMISYYDTVSGSEFEIKVSCKRAAL